MYLQITTRCSMECPHCCFGCTDKGTDMSMDVVDAACRLVADGEGMLFIGGGEPTLHPRFWDIVGRVMAANIEFADACGIAPVQLITNGTETKHALKLARLAANGTISCGLSQDAYHDNIDQRVIDAFTPEKGCAPPNDRDGRFIRSVTRIMQVGRGRNITGAELGCEACGSVIDPEGRIWRCVCKGEQLGDVWTGYHLYDGMSDDDLGCTIKDGLLRMTEGCWWRPDWYDNDPYQPELFDTSEFTI